MTPLQQVIDKHDRDKIVALLKSLAAPCEVPKSNDDHAWRKCRHCLAQQELDAEDVRALLRRYLAAEETECQRGQAAQRVRDAAIEKVIASVWSLDSAVYYQRFTNAIINIREILRGNVELAISLIQGEENK